MLALFFIILTKTSYFLNRERGPAETDTKQNSSSDSFVHDLQLETRPIDNINYPFVRLLGGEESPESAELRWKLYCQAWNHQQERISELVESENAKVLEDVAHFVSSAWDHDVDAKVATAILLPGSNIANHLRLFAQIYKRVEQQPTAFLVSLSSKDCPNLKMALKKIVAKITEDNEEPADLEEGDIRFDRRLRYDLDILAEWCRKQVKSNDHVQSIDDIRIVVSIEDADTFDISILSGLINMIQSYIDQIPFKLMLSVATSLEVFQGKLSRSSIRQMAGTSIQAEIRNGISKVLEISMFRFTHNSTLLLGPNLFTALVNRQTQSMESIDAFTSSLKYVYMSHFYSNPFIVVLNSPEWTGNYDDISLEQQQQQSSLKTLLSPRHLKAIRLLNSFRRSVETAASASKYDDVKQLLANDEFLLTEVSNAIIGFNNYVIALNTILEIIMLLQNWLGLEKHHVSKLQLYPLAITGQLANESIINIILQELEQADEFKIQNILLSIQNLPVDPKAHEFLITLCNHIQVQDKDSIRSSLLDPIKESYKERFLYEIFVPDSASLQENVFLPTYRAALEMALSYPSHYWGKAPEPHISILYQLYRESSLFINIYDYYTAFRENCCRPDSVTDEEWNKMTMAWFLQGIAELKLIGILRDSKRKFECVEKIAWKDL